MDWLCTPATPQMTMMAPSSTRSARSTSMVKSTWPGVSMMLQQSECERTLLPSGTGTGAHGVSAAPAARCSLDVVARPAAEGGGRLNGDTALAFELHAVHLGAHAVFALRT